MKVIFSPAIMEPDSSVNSIIVGAKTITRDQVESPIKPVEPFIPGIQQKLALGLVFSVHLQE